MTSLTLHSGTQPETAPDNLFDAALLRAIADLAETRGEVGFTPGGGLLFDRPLAPSERKSLPLPSTRRPQLLDLPEDRFAAHLGADPEFRSFVETFTVRHAAPGYRLVAIPLSGRLTASQLRGLASAAEAFGHDRVRITPNVSLRLTHVPTALLRPLFRSLRAAGLLTSAAVTLAA